MLALHSHCQELPSLLCKAQGLQERSPHLKAPEPLSLPLTLLLWRQWSAPPRAPVPVGTGGPSAGEIRPAIQPSELQ